MHSLTCDEFIFGIHRQDIKKTWRPTTDILFIRGGPAIMQTRTEFLQNGGNSDMCPQAYANDLCNFSEWFLCKRILEPYGSDEARKGEINKLGSNYILI